MTNLPKISRISDIRIPDPADGMPSADVDIGDHGAAVTVHGETVDECISRAVVIRDAFNAKVT